MGCLILFVCSKDEQRVCLPFGHIWLDLLMVICLQKLSLYDIIYS